MSTIKCSKCSKEIQPSDIICIQRRDYEKRLDQARDGLLRHYTSHITRHARYILSFIGTFFIFTQFALNLNRSDPNIAPFVLPHQILWSIISTAIGFGILCFRSFHKNAFYYGKITGTIVNDTQIN